MKIWLRFCALCAGLNRHCWQLNDWIEAQLFRAWRPVMARLTRKNFAAHEAGHALVAYLLGAKEISAKIGFGTVCPRMGTAVLAQCNYWGLCETNRFTQNDWERLVFLIAGAAGESVGRDNVYWPGSGADAQLAVQLLPGAIRSAPDWAKIWPANDAALKFIKCNDSVDKAVVSAAYHHARTMLSYNRVLFNRFAKTLVKHRQADQTIFKLAA